MASKTQIANLALRRIGVSRTVANVETERSIEATTINDAWDAERDVVLRDFAWPWARAYAELGLVPGPDPVNRDWRFAYRLPADCLFARRLTRAGVGRADVEPPPFALGNDDQGGLLFTDEADAELEYTRRVIDPVVFDPDFASALAYRLAATIGPSLSRVEQIGERMLALYVRDVAYAQQRAANEGQSPPAADAEWIQQR